MIEQNKKKRRRRNRDGAQQVQKATLSFHWLPSPHSSELLWRVKKAPFWSSVGFKITAEWPFLLTDKETGWWTPCCLDPTKVIAPVLSLNAKVFWSWEESSIKEQREWVRTWEGVLTDPDSEKGRGKRSSCQRKLSWIWASQHKWNWTYSFGCSGWQLPIWQDVRKESYRLRLALGPRLDQWRPVLLLHHLQLFFCFWILFGLCLQIVFYCNLFLGLEDRSSLLWRRGIPSKLMSMERSRRLDRLRLK